jgi:hypothetical protein
VRIRQLREAGAPAECQCLIEPRPGQGTMRDPYSVKPVAPGPADMHGLTSRALRHRSHPY